MRMLPILVFAAYAAAVPTQNSRADSAAAHAKKSVQNAATAKSASPKPKPQPTESHDQESGRSPSSASRPDTSFARASEWESAEPEILEYAVKRPGAEGDSRGRGRLLTERLFLRPDGTTLRPSDGADGERDATDILNAALLEEEGGDVPFSIETVCQFTRKGKFSLLRQEESLQGWPGTTHRSLDCRSQPPRLRVSSSGGEAPRDTLLARWPVYTEAMLFTYLRAIPQHAGYHEEVWLQDWGREGSFHPVPRYAEITVHAKEMGVRDVDTWYVTVDRDDGRRMQFWIGASGLHAVVVAELSDGTEWILKGISRKKYRLW
ncbi:MAG: hypothetical protein JF616_09355 [Fibrobacteres bacterium]|nr:hypothetical protein [Fibrobacterota bacterium]